MERTAQPVEGQNDGQETAATRGGLQVSGRAAGPEARRLQTSRIPTSLPPPGRLSPVTAFTRKSR